MPVHGGHLWRKHPGVTSGSDLSFGERAADLLKRWFGTWSLLGAVAAGITFWLLFIRDPGDLHLNLILSCMAAVQGVILQVAANRGDRISAEVALHTEGNTTELVSLNRQQIEILRRLDGLDGTVGNLADVVQQVLAARSAPEPPPAPAKVPVKAPKGMGSRLPRERM